MTDYLYSAIAGLFLAGTFLLLQPSQPAQIVEETQAYAPAPVGVLESAPSLSARRIDGILASYGSPAQGEGEAFYSLGLQYGIDPAYALAFFVHESGAGTNPAWAGIKPGGSTTHNLGNIICAGYASCWGRFRDYASWREGIEGWYRLIKEEYIIGRGHRTVADVIPVYAPSFENDVEGYVSAVHALVDGWRGETATPPPCPLDPCWQSGTGYSADHPGVDLGATLGQPVYAVMDGVAEPSTTWPCGNGVMVTQGRRQALVCHLNSFAVASGETVRAGQQIGTAGSSGLSTGPHVHYEIRIDGVNVPPL
jgi:hypothetical protein